MLNDIYSLSIDNVTLNFIMNRGSFLRKSAISMGKPFHSHGYYEILISFDHQNNLILPSGKVSLPRNTATIIAPTCIHTTESLNPQNLSSIGFFYEKHEKPIIRYDLFSIFEDVFGNGCTDYRQGIADEGICDLIQQLKGFSTQNNPIADGVTISALTQLLFNILADMSEGDKNFITEKSPKKQFINSRLNVFRLADERLTSEFASNISPDELAEEFHISSRQLNRYFREQYGMTMSQRRTNLRMEMAKKLLLQTDLPVLEIAKKVGYHSVKTFYSVFRTYFQTSPTTFREQENNHPIT